MKLLSWNVRKNEISRYVSSCLSEHDVDIAVISEYKELDFGSICAPPDSCYSCFDGNGGCEHIRFIVKRGIELKARREQERYSIVEATVAGTRYYIAGLHLQDRRNCEPNSRMAVARRIMADIDNLRRSSGCGNVVVIGDFNAGPFDPELLQRDSFNAVLFKDIIEKSETCKYGGVTYRRLYNPTVHYISEAGKMYGSYYLNATETTSPIWHCLDQALVSKPLVHSIADYRYLRTIGGEDLVTKTKPKGEISDHLPLLVEISDPEEQR